MGFLLLTAPCLLVGFMAGLLTFQRKQQWCSRCGAMLTCPHPATGQADEPRQRWISDMMRDQLILSLVALPATSDVVVQVGELHVDIVGVRHSGGRDSIVLTLDPDDVRDALKWCPVFSTGCSQLTPRACTNDQ